MTDLPARLVRLAQQLEDQHAPQHMTILMREAAKEMEQNLGQVAKLSEEITRLRAALRFYADPDIYRPRAEAFGDGMYAPHVILDAGYNARAALGGR